jgi:hypothetical protein
MKQVGHERRFHPRWSLGPGEDSRQAHGDPVNQAAVGEHRRRLLHHQLVAAVDHLRRKRGGIVNPVRQRIAKHRDRAGIDYPEAGTDRSSLKQQVVHRIDIDPPRGRWIGFRRPARHRGKVDQCIAAARQRNRTDRRIAEVSSNDFRSRRNRPGRRIDTDHAVTARKQSGNQLAPDKPARAGDDDPHSLSTRPKGA